MLGADGYLRMLDPDSTVAGVLALGFTPLLDTVQRYRTYCHGLAVKKRFPNPRTRIIMHYQNTQGLAIDT